MIAEKKPNFLKIVLFFANFNSPIYFNIFFVFLNFSTNFLTYFFQTAEISLILSIFANFEQLLTFVSIYPVCLVGRHRRVGRPAREETDFLETTPPYNIADLKAE